MSQKNKELVEIFVPMYNGMHILPLFLDHYLERFPGCVITIYDDGSTDGSGDYCKSRGCNVIYNILEPHKDISCTHLRNNCWKTSEAEWIIIVDQDELVNISLDDLDKLNDFDVLIFKGYNMIGLEGQNEPKDFTHGQLHPWYCKPSMFRKSIGEMNYIGGAHAAYPHAETRYNIEHFTMCHYPKRLYTLNDFTMGFPDWVEQSMIDDFYSECKINLTKLR
jgi:glycosyltransferase involved in cell wall biosynthesis